MNNTAPDDEPDDVDRLPTRPAGAAGRSRRALLAVEVIAIGAAIVLAVVLIGHPKLSLVFPWQSESDPGASAPTARRTGAKIAAASFRFDPAKRTFLTDGLKGTVPTAWFIRQGRFLDIGGPGVGGCFGNGCQHSPVGQHPMEDNIPWGAEFEVVQVEDALTGTDLSRTADMILSYWRQYTVFYTDVSGSVTVKNKSKRTLTANLPRPATMITAELHYRKPGAKINYDHFYLLVVRGTVGNYTAYVAAWSDNATDDTTDAIQDSINTLQVV